MKNSIAKAYTKKKLKLENFQKTIEKYIYLARFE